MHSQSPTVLDTERSPVQEVQDYWETFFFYRGIDAPHRSASWHSNKLSPPLLSAIEDLVGIVLHLCPTS